MNLDVPPPNAAEAPHDADADRPPPLSLGHLRFSPPVILAPMSGLTNWPMRVLCEQAGCGLTVTEFLAAPALAAGVAKEVHKVQPSPGGRIWAAQIFGRDPGQMARAARFCVDRGAEIVDINMGCPARRVTSGVAGVALMREPELAESLVKAVGEAVTDRALVTVKIRAGWDKNRRNAPEFAGRMVEAGAALVTVHGRTARQGYSGKADRGIIAAVKRAVDVPVVGNGDVVDAASLSGMFADTGCDAVMIGRAALGNPWLFAQCKAWWEGRPIPPAATEVQRLKMYLEHLDLYLQIAQTDRAVIEMRKFAGWYVKGFCGAAALRKAVYAEQDIAAIRATVQRTVHRLDHTPSETNPPALP